MAETTTKHAQGTFCWPEIGSPDIEASKKFYGSLFGWTAQDIPMDNNGSYTIFNLEGRAAGAMYALGEEMKKQGIPPNWGAYIAVENADEIAKKCTALGGKVMMEPMDVMGIGRTAVLQDPTGAHVSVWQAISHPGVGVMDEPNSLAWTELLTNDTAKAKAFYTALVGWTTEDMPMGPETYTLFKRADGKNAGGMMKMPANLTNVPPNWTSYFQVSDIRATVARSESMGGKTNMPVTPIPGVGEFAVVQDPQGAVFGLLQYPS